MIEPTGVITVIAIALFGVAVMLRLLPVGTCPECGHCRLERLRKEAELEARNACCTGYPVVGHAAATTIRARITARDEAVVKRPEAAERSVAIPSAETSMRMLELAVGLIAGVAALPLGFGR